MIGIFEEIMAFRRLSKIRHLRGRSDHKEKLRTLFLLFPGVLFLFLFFLKATFFAHLSISARVCPLVVVAHSASFANDNSDPPNLPPSD